MGAVEENQDEPEVSEKERVDTGTGQNGSLGGRAGETLDKPSDCVKDGHVLDDDHHGQVGDLGVVVSDTQSDSIQFLNFAKK